jgi:hypothetical protein
MDTKPPTNTQSGGRISPHFEGGRNIAMKLPAHVFAETVSFYKDVLRLPLLEEGETSVVFEFGANRLWLDCADHLSQAEVWLELRTDDTAAATDHFKRYGTQRRDEIEALPEGFDGFWVCNPANIIHLVSKE